ncbi:hypothetical protein EF907_25150 [Streptomyces sp. WAC06273]|nr:hypothetical protein EF907_25150 [Streptomyces sp. WAC06273]
MPWLGSTSRTAWCSILRRTSSSESRPSGSDAARARPSPRGGPSSGGSGLRGSGLRASGLRGSGLRGSGPWSAGPWFTVPFPACVCLCSSGASRRASWPSLMPVPPWRP